VGLGQPQYFAVKWGAEHCHFSAAAFSTARLTELVAHRRSASEILLNEADLIKE
jgi:hypothetical protein